MESVGELKKNSVFAPIDINYPSGERDAKYDDFLNDLQKAGDSECR